MTPAGDHLDEILYPAIEPYETGYLLVGDGQRVYWEQSGNPEGKPVVFLHGGPGGGTSPWQRRLPEIYRICAVLFDQRGCGGDRAPHMSRPMPIPLQHDLRHLVADMELLRKNLGIDRWQVFGGSWGSALALAYAECHPDAVTEIVLRGVFTLGTSWSGFTRVGRTCGSRTSGHPVLERSRMIEAYHRRLSDPDPAVHQPPLPRRTAWEASTLTLESDHGLVDSMTEPAQALAFARIENHYFLNGGWFREGRSSRDVGAIRGIPAVIVQGRYDVCTPIMTAWDLHRAWPEADFVVVPDAGHSATEPGIARALRAATERFLPRDAGRPGAPAELESLDAPASARALAS
ncbi:MAG: prolyl aminopeptidase [Microbacterium sp.]